MLNTQLWEDDRDQTINRALDSPDPLNYAISSPAHPTLSQQTQTFCPQFHCRQTLALTLDAQGVAALASGEARVALWHHAPRAQAVAAALARGQPGGSGSGGQSVHLGSAACCLAPLLTRPQVRLAQRCLTPRRFLSLTPRTDIHVELADPSG